MDLTLWSNKTISIDYTWMSGDLLLLAYGNERPKFKLGPKYITDSDGKLRLAQFTLTYDPGFMIPNWHDLVMTPMGSTLPPAVSGLPPWQDTVAIRQAYSTALTPLYNVLIDPATPTTMFRLETYLPVDGATPGSLIIDRIRMVYLKGAVTDGTDLVLVTINAQEYTGGNLQQNGGGSGPPN